ncbi:MAG: hypothetical protein NVS2B9_05220 [Myxococcales bacterium]
MQDRAQKFHHPGTFPVELPRWCISLHGQPGAVVLDPFAGAGTTLVVFLLLVSAGPAQVGGDTALRYSIPFLLAGSVLPLLLSAPPKTSLRSLGDGASALAFAGVIALFAPSLATRVRQARTWGSSLSIGHLARSGASLAASDLALSSAEKDRLRRVQALVPAGAPLVAWIAQPFDLDFARNRIIDVEPAGLATPWARVPAEARFVLWQYAKPAVRIPAQLSPYLSGAGAHDRAESLRTLAFLRRLEALAGSATRLYDDGRWMLFRLQEGDAF